MSILDACIDIIEPGYEAPRATQTYEASEEQRATLRELNRRDFARDEAVRERERRAYAFRSTGLQSPDATIAQRRGEVCRCCLSREAVGASGLCSRRLCREVTDLHASAKRSEWHDKSPKTKARMRERLREREAEKRAAKATGGAR